MFRQRAGASAGSILTGQRDAAPASETRGTHVMQRSEPSSPRPSLSKGIFLAALALALRMVPAPAHALAPGGENRDAVASDRAVTDVAFGWNAPAPETDTGNGIAGLTLAPVTPEMRTACGLAADTGGALVAAVAPRSAAAAGGLEPGDVIVRVGNAPAASPEDVTRRITAARLSGKSGIALLVVRGQTTYYLALLLTTR
jgi:membrane-associated protease RseP (regulator of RpoE activity)